MIRPSAVLAVPFEPACTHAARGTCFACASSSAAFTLLPTVADRLGALAAAAAVSTMTAGQIAAAAGRAAVARAAS